MDDGYYLPPIETHLIPSKHVAQTFKIQIMQPLRKPGQQERFPVVYATDGNLSFDMLMGISRLIQTYQYDAPRFILVSIGYPGESPWAGAALRVRDLTFPGYPRMLIKPPPVSGVLTAPAGTKDYYGAEDFQQFISTELIPFIDTQYPVAPGDRTYFGHSAGGGFGVYTLFTRPDLFRNYILSSPGLIYHGKTSAGIQYDNHELAPQYARDFIASGRTLPDVRVYMSVGTEEEFEPGVEQWQLTSSFYRMARLLKAASIPGLTLHTETFPGETHMTVWPMAFIHGVRAVMRAT